MADPRPACPECGNEPCPYGGEECDGGIHHKVGCTWCERQVTGQREAPPLSWPTNLDRLREATKEAPPASPETPPCSHRGGHSDPNCQEGTLPPPSRPRRMTNYHGEPCGKCGQFTVLLRCLSCEVDADAGLMEAHIQDCACEGLPTDAWYEADERCEDLRTRLRARRTR